MELTSQVIDTSAGPVSVVVGGRGPDLVMLHSLLTDKHVFDRVATDLTADHRVTLVDLPGYGETPLSGNTIDEAADVIGAMLEAGGYDPGATTLLGNGFGGFVALATALRHGDKFAKLVLAGAGSTFPDDARPAFLAMKARVEEGGMAAVIETALGRIFSPEYAAEHPDMLAERRQVLERTNPAAFMAACEALSKLDYADAVAAIENPALLVVGSEDWPTPPAMGRQLAESMPNCTYLELPGIAHAPQLQDPPVFVAAIRPFLAA